MKENFLNKTVVVTGHTGFKGSWLTAWLKNMGAKVIGISLDPPTTPSHFISADIANGIIDQRIDIRSSQGIEESIVESSPDFVFHLAAQPIVAQSYENPIETWNVNVFGTINILEALRRLDKACSAVIITSDKCYKNVEWTWGYRENDSLGGSDPYSASKGAAEIAISSYIQSYFPLETSKVRISSARAGNVIGGGDWATGRIIPDCVEAWAKGDFVTLRNPFSTRPWQHVLEPLGGYLSLASQLTKRPELHGEAFNFGPAADQNYTVLALVEKMSEYWPKVRWKEAGDIEKISEFYESGLLKLNCDKALHLLNWKAILGFEETIRLTANWYHSFYSNPEKIGSITESQINEYQELFIS